MPRLDTTPDDDAPIAALCAAHQELSTEFLALSRIIIPSTSDTAVRRDFTAVERARFEALDAEMDRIDRVLGSRARHEHTILSRLASRRDHLTTRCA